VKSNNPVIGVLFTVVVVVVFLTVSFPKGENDTSSLAKVNQSQYYNCWK
jgi:hypothetical protein